MTLADDLAWPTPEPLVAHGIVKTYGGLAAVDGVSLVVPPGEVTALIGPNGAGKTTMFQCLTGIEQADGGTVRLGSVDLTGLPADARARRGLGRTFQRLAVFTGMTVLDNLMVAAERSYSSLLRDLVRVRHSDDRTARRRAEIALEVTGLTADRDRFAAELPAGTLRRVEVARALCAKPRVLLLDEPAGGLDDAETDQLRDLLQVLTDAGLGVLLVEHDVELVLAVSASVNVLQTGRLIASGLPAQVAVDPLVREAYLGPAA